MRVSAANLISVARETAGASTVLVVLGPAEVTWQGADSPLLTCREGGAGAPSGLQLDQIQFRRGAAGPSLGGGQQLVRPPALPAVQRQLLTSSAGSASVSSRADTLLG